jgi:hypothetical protein
MLRQHILDPLGIQLSPAAWIALQSTKDQDLEWEFVQRLFIARYSISYTLMWMQTTIDPSLSLVRILGNEILCGLFVTAHRMLTEKEHRYRYRLVQRNDMLTAIRKRCTEELVNPTGTIHSGTPFQVIPLPGDHGKIYAANPLILLKMVQDAAYDHTITLDMLHCHVSPLQIELALRTLHASAALARYAATFFQNSKSAAGMVILLQTRQHFKEWLSRYFTSGCACVR